MDCILNAITANAGFIDPVILQLGIFVVPDKLYAAEIRDVLPVLNVVNPGGGVNGENDYPHTVPQAYKCLTING